MLSKKEKKQLINKIGGKWYQLSVSDKIEEAKVLFEDKKKEYKVYYVNDKPLLAEVKGRIIPILCGQRVEGNGVVVDEGAVKFITNGADVMRPGIVELRGSFKKDDIVLIFSEKLVFPIAVGIALYDSNEIMEMKRGKVIKNVHHLGDDLFRLCRGSP